LRDERRNYLVAGSFVLAMLVLLLVWLALLAGRTGATEPYFVVYERVNGLRSGTEIFFDGYPVGLIDDITPVDSPDGRRFRVDLRIRRGWPVPEDSRARILEGLFARVVVDIHGGRAERLVPPGGEIPGEATGDVFASAGALVARVADLVEELQPLVHRAAEDAPEILAHVASLTQELDHAGTQLGRVLSPENVDRAGRALENLEYASKSLAPLGRNLDQTRARVDELLARVNELLREDRGDVSEALRDLNHSLSTVARHIDAISGDLETSSRNLAEFTRQVREDPGVLVRGRDHPDDGAQP
jgi:phospholipid/cholesterol/gamma-HCH transport system substrate-binding protein